jgi:hypothetical protein
MSIVKKNAWSPIGHVGGRVIGTILGILDQYYAGGQIIGGVKGGYSGGAAVVDRWISPDSETKKYTAQYAPMAQDYYTEGKIKNRTLELGTNTEQVECNR